MPDVGAVAGEAAGEDEHCVDAQVVACAHKARRKRGGGGRDPPQPIFVERQRRPLGGRAGLDFDEGDGAAAAGDEVDLAHRSAGAAGEDAPALKLEPERRQRFRTPTATLALAPLVQLGRFI